MKKTVRISIAEQEMNFAAGHFTIFSATERESLHGHNYTASFSLETTVNDDGMAFDYFLPRAFLTKQCGELNHIFLLPGQSPYLKIEKKDDYIFAIFNGERIPFLDRDVKILPVRNISLEELSSYLLDVFVKDFIEKGKHPVSFAEITVSSTLGTSITSCWGKKSL